MIELINNTVKNDEVYNVINIDFKVVNTIEERNLISAEFRKKGMLVKVIDDGIIYELGETLENNTWSVNSISVEKVTNYDDISSSTNIRFIIVERDENNNNELGLYIHDSERINEILLL